MDERLIGVYRSVGGGVQATKYYSMERISRVDATTGAKIMQLTSYPVLSHTLYYHCPCFTPSGTLVFLTYSGPGRLASPDAWRVELDGSDLRPITRHDGLAGFVVSPDGATLYAQDSGRLLAFPTDPDASPKAPEVVGELPDVDLAATILGSITADGAYYVSAALMKNGATALARYATDGTAAEVLLERGMLAHVQIDPSGSDRILWGGPGDGGTSSGLWTCEIDGSNVREFKLPESTGHYGFYGSEGKLLSTVNKPFGSIVVAEEGGEPEIVAKGGHFWHAAGSRDGHWIVSDTNWPDIGLVLINADTGLWAPLCHPGSSSGHPQWTHPHPMFSPDGRYVVYNSDRTGIGQVYAVEVPEELRDQLSG